MLHCILYIHIVYCNVWHVYMALVWLEVVLLCLLSMWAGGGHSGVTEVACECGCSETREHGETDQAVVETGTPRSVTCYSLLPPSLSSLIFLSSLSPRSFSLLSLSSIFSSLYISLFSLSFSLLSIFLSLLYMLPVLFSHMPFTPIYVFTLISIY